MPKSSQAARNSCLSALRSSGSRRRQAGSTLKNVNFANVRSAIGVTIALVVVAVGAGIPGVVSLNFFGDAAAAVRGSGAEKAQDASPHSGSSVTLAWVPRGTSVWELT